MATDKERRKVARRLRKTIGLTEFAEALGFNWTDDSDWRWKDVSNLVADLIDPTCDRDALLGLVKELELGAQCFVGRKWPDVECERMAKHLADDYEMIASRIRKALGAES